MNAPAQTEKTRAAIMNIRIAFSESTPEHGDKKIEALGQVFNTAAPVVVRNGGRLTRAAEEGIEAVFERSAENALACALDLFSDITMSSDPGQRPEISVGIHTATVFFSKMSFGEFSAPVAISDGVYIARKLSEAASRYDARILISRTALSDMRSFETRFNSRKLGKIYLQRSDSEDMIYDIFDSDPTNLKYRKRRSRLVFETGVSLFMNGEYLQSRNYFIELLKYDRNDKTAKDYVLLCDKAISGKPLEKREKYLEIW